MHWLTLLFLAAVVLSTALELWLSQRQIGAVAAHRNRVPEPFAAAVSADEHAKAADYTIAKARFGRVAEVLNAVVTLVLTLGGGIAAIDALWRHTGWSQPWLGTAVVGSVLLLTAVIHLPLSVWSTFKLEARFGFNRTTPALFIADLAKSLLLSVLIGGPLLVATLALMERAGRLWWIWAWLLWLAVMFIMTWAYPAFIAPLFNKFSPLKDDVLKSRIEALLTRCGFKSRGVFVVDNSRRSSHGNAYFTGIGTNKRIVFFDTLLDRLTHQEVEGVLAHELGHFSLKHVRKRLIVSVATTFIALAILGWLTEEPAFYSALGVPTPSTHAALLLFITASPFFTFFITPLGSFWSRRHEFEADAFATQHANASELANALVKLYRDNASTLTPDPVYVAFHYSHPPALERIGRLAAAAPH
ncbi:MAG TPA: M48 family metallopeptidase [Steroidobacteraceae bacterium]|nr:M48 family metallopeptidase [Steroidobacteraceae bacterium]